MISGYDGQDIRNNQENVGGCMLYSPNDAPSYGVGLKYLDA